jgi:hypothetical protein
MKVAVINLSGNTGKTTISKHLLAPLLPNAKRAQIEDVNTGDGEADASMAAKKFKSLAAELNVADDDENFVIDIGASNAKAMIENFSQLSSTRAAIDFWVIPVVSAAKQKADSLNTIKVLTEIGVSTDKIVLLLNNVIDTESVESDFSTILAVRKIGCHVADEVILASEVFEMLKGGNDSVFAIEAAKPDFKALKKVARESGDPDALSVVGQRMVLQDMAEAACANLRAVFEATPMAAALAETA